MPELKEYIFEAMKDCPLSGQQEKALISALEKYIATELEDKINAIDTWNKMLKAEGVEYKFTQMVCGRHDSVGDGWRKLTLKNGDYITLERNPAGYFIHYNNTCYKFTDNKMGEQMCVDFDNIWKKQ